MNVRIDQYGFIYIQRGIIWRPQICKHALRAQEPCRDTCPLFNEYFITKNKAEFACSSCEAVQHDIVEDDRMRRKEND